MPALDLRKDESISPRRPAKRAAIGALAGHPMELEGIIDVLGPRRIPVYFTHASDLDLTTPDGQLRARIMGAVARNEVQKKSQRQKMTNGHRASKGLPYKSVRAFGYRFDGSGNFVADPTEAEAIRWAQRHIMSGGTVASVAREWNARGLTTVRGRQWVMTAVKQALLNPALAGYRAYQPTSVLMKQPDKRLPAHKRDLTRGAWAAILPERDWTAMVHTLTEKRSSVGNNLKHLGAGIYLCAVSGNGATLATAMRQLSNKSATVRAYRCRAKAHMAVIAEPVDAYVEDTVRRLLRNPYVYDEIFGEDDEPVDLGPIERERAELRERLVNLGESFAAQRIPLAVLESASAQIQARLAVLDAEAAEAAENAHMREMFIDPAKVDVAWSAADIEIRRRILSQLFPRILVFPSGGTRGGRPPASHYVHMYDRRGRLAPLPIGPEEEAILIQQMAHAARYGLQVQ